MRRIIINFLLIILITVGAGIVYFKFIKKEPTGLISKFSWQGKKEITEELLQLKRRWPKWIVMSSFWPRSLAIRGNCLYASDYWNHHIQILKINSDGSLTPKLTFGKKGKGLGEFNRPEGLIKGKYLFVIEIGNHRIQVLKIDSDGSLISKFIFGKKREGSWEFFSGPDSLVIKGNHLYVAETGNGYIHALKINSDGSLSPKFIFNKKDEGLRDFNPGKLLVKDDYLYAADQHNQLIHILKINSDGSLSFKFVLGKMGKWGKGLGEFSSGPDNLIIKGNYLYVTDTNNHHIQVLKINPDGSLTPKFIFGKEGGGLGEFNIPGSLVIEGNYLYVADTGTHHIQVLKINSDGSLTAKFIFGRKGEGLGEFNIPGSLVIEGNYLYVSDAGNDRIQVLEIQYN